MFCPNKCWGFFLYFSNYYMKGGHIAMLKNEQEEIVIDFREYRQKLQEAETKEEKEQLNESWLRMFGGVVKTILRQMFGDVNLPTAKIRGSKRDVRSFGRALKSEKDYMTSFSKYGLDDPKTYDNKYKLDKAIKNFEKETGIKWPFK